MFIGREEELTYLNDKYQSDRSEFVVLYGRRRIGKTELLKEFVKDKKHIFYSGHQITDYMQLVRITSVLVEHFQSKIYSQAFDGWENVLSYIGENMSSNEKTVIIFDEFPYMVESNISIPSVLQSAWDHQLSRKNIMLIICGSSMSFMEKDILSEKNPLYGRTTGILKLNEMSFESSKGFFMHQPIEEQVAYYSVFSGVPYYLRLIDTKKNFKENIVNNILRNGSVLFNEVEFLLKQELREVSVYNAIISAIALGKTKSNEIVQLTGIEKTKLPYYINNLIDLGMVKKEFPSTIKAKEMIQSRAGIYNLDNSFFKFYYRFVYPYISELLDGNIDVIYEDIIERQMADFLGHEFEKIAISHLRSLNNIKALPIRFLKIGRWWDKGVEIDIVAYDVQGQYLFGECKWKNEKVGIKTLHQLQEKSASIKVDVSNKYFVIFSKKGFTEELTNLANSTQQIMLVDFSQS